VTRDEPPLFEQVFDTGARVFAGATLVVTACIVTGSDQPADLAWTERIEAAARTGATIGGIAAAIACGLVILLSICHRPKINGS
jgi:hypothetical protein